MEIESFSPDISKEALNLLKKRLLDTRWPHTIGGDDWAYGVPNEWLREMVDYWANTWSWEKVAQEISRYEHFKVEIEGISIHFLRSKGTKSNSIPIILTHGWPWTFWDFREVITPLSSPKEKGSPSFDVIVPSLPGFGFSTPLTHAGVDVPTVAYLWNKLMTEVLGYESYAAHGGDWGSLITAHLGHAYSENVIGVHLGLPVVPGLIRSELPDHYWIPEEKELRDRADEAAPSLKSHLAVHTNDPHTLAHALIDSPVGTAAWLWERRYNWSDNKGDIESVFSREDLCTNASLYWCTGAITSSLRMYFEHFNKPWPLAHDRQPVIESPTAYAIFPKDVVMLPKKIAEEKTNLLRWTVMPAGGHFGAAEQPSLLVNDIQETFSQLYSK